MKCASPFPGAIPVRIAAFCLSLTALAPRALAEELPQATAAECAAVVERFQKDAAADPGRLILAVEDALTTNELCACRIVTLAVGFASAEPKLTGQIVGAAVRIAPAMAPAIVQCAVEAAPDAAAEIRKALEKELGKGASEAVTPPAAQEKEGNAAPAEDVATAMGKQPLGKGPLAPAPTVGEDVDSAPDWASISPVGLTGIYLSPPSSGSGVRAAGSTEIRTRTVIVRETVVAKPRRPSSPVTKSEPD